MKTRVKLVTILLAFILGSNLDAKEDKSSEYLKYVKEITDDFIKEMEQKYKLHCYGSGGRMPHDVEEISVLFMSYQKPTIQEARKNRNQCHRRTAV